MSLKSAWICWYRTWPWMSLKSAWIWLFLTCMNPAYNIFRSCSILQFRFKCFTSTFTELVRFLWWLLVWWLSHARILKSTTRENFKLHFCSSIPTYFNTTHAPWLISSHFVKQIRKWAAEKHLKWEVGFSKQWIDTLVSLFDDANID